MSLLDECITTLGHNTEFTVDMKDNIKLKKHRLVLFNLGTGTTH